MISDIHGIGCPIEQDCAGTTGGPSIPQQDVDAVGVALVRSLGMANFTGPHADVAGFHM